MSEKIAILDCGGQYTKVIDRKVRELGVMSDILPITAAAERLQPYSAIILSGGPSSIYDPASPKYDPAILDMGKPILGICYGMQLINHHFGGVVSPSVLTEYGAVEVEVDTACPLFEGLKSSQTVLMSHGDSVETVAAGFQRVGVTGDVVAAIYDPARKIVGVQFHPEVEITQNGDAMLENFLRRISGLKEIYALEDRIKTSVEAIRQKVGGSNVLVLVSGGVDSAVTAALLVKALDADKVFAIHIDHGLMRKDESDLICANLAKLGLKHMKRVNAEDYFFNKKVEVAPGVMAGPLSRTNEPELKRQIIGRAFIDVTRIAAEELGFDLDTTYLAQGTLRPDLIESGNPDVSSHANVIKTHHNDVDIIRRFRERGMIIETNWDWHKDEVRKVARMLGLDEDIAARQPFPGPGLGVRIICSDRDAVTVAPSEQEALDNTVDELNRKYATAFKATIAPVRSVGVQGDARSYKSLAILEGYGPDFKWEDVASLTRDIPNKLGFINRVAYLLNRKSAGGGMVCGDQKINRASADLMRKVDAIVREHLVGPKIAQCLAVVFPVSATQGKKVSVAVRAIVTTDFMTARPAVPGVDFPADALGKIADAIAAMDEVDMVVYDATGKPPATVEWE